ncbi:MAG: response regulator transcription factor [Reichenbachiella sp.]
MSNKILLVDDEANMLIGLKDNLEFEGYEVDVAVNGQEGHDAIMQGNYDLVLLDVMMPIMSGFDVCKKVRAAGVQTPIILLTAKGQEIDKVLGLELGADDYITKPFGVRELLARLKAVMRRGTTPVTEDNSDFNVGNVIVNFHTYTAKDSEGEAVKMSHKEFEILHYLIGRKNEIVTRFDLLEKVWGYENTPTTRTVDNFIVKLRHKIEANPNDPQIIITVHGTGYKFIA